MGPVTRCLFIFVACSPLLYVPHCHLSIPPSIPSVVRAAAEPAEGPAEGPAEVILSSVISTIRGLYSHTQATRISHQALAHATHTLMPHSSGPPSLPPSQPPSLPASRRPSLTARGVLSKKLSVGGLHGQPSGRVHPELLLHQLRPGMNCIPYRPRHPTSFGHIYQYMRVPR